MVEKTVDELYNELQVSMMAGKPGPNKGEAASALVMDALRAGEPLICLRNCKLDGTLYSQGDEYYPRDINNPRIELLVSQGWFIGKQKWEAGRKYYQTEKHHREFIRPALDRYHHSVEEVTRQAAKVAEMEARLREAKDKLVILEAQRAGLEKQLRDAITGTDLDQNT